MTPPDRPVPTDDVDPTAVIDITVKRDTGLELTFADGMVAQFELVDVRTHCPCATCRSLRERGEVAWPRPGAPLPLAITDARLHGAWGLNIDWNDGHGSGIFPFDAFRRWAEGDQPFGPDSGLPGAFEAGESADGGGKGDGSDPIAQI